LPGWNYTLQRHGPGDLLLPTRFNLLKFSPPPNCPWSYESINGLIHSWGQRPHNLTISKGLPSQHCCTGTKCSTHEVLGISDPNHNSWVLVAYAYNPSYSVSRDQEDHGSKPAFSK
jgi:hypothetical protein